MDCKKIEKELRVIYQRHRKKYKGNPDSEQLCCMWSTSNPPDEIEDTKPLLDIEKAFDINIDEELAYSLYDMTIDEAVLENEQ